MRTPKKSKTSGKTVSDYCKIKRLSISEWISANDIKSFADLYEICEKMRLCEPTEELKSLFQDKEEPQIEKEAVQQSVEPLPVVKVVKQKKQKKTYFFEEPVNFANEDGDTTQEQYLESAPDISRS